MNASLFEIKMAINSTRKSNDFIGSEKENPPSFIAVTSEKTKDERDFLCQVSSALRQLNFFLGQTQFPPQFIYRCLVVG